MAQFLDQVTDRCNLFFGYKKEDRSTDYELEKKEISHEKIKI